MIAVTTKARQAVSRAHRSIQELVDALIATLAAGDEWVLADCQRALTSLDALEPHLASRRGRGMQPSPRVALAVRLAAHADVTARFMDEGPDRRRAPGKRRGAPKVSLADEGKLVAFVAALVRLALGARPQDQEGDEIDEDAAIGRAIRRAMPGKVRKRT